MRFLKFVKSCLVALFFLNYSHIQNEIVRHIKQFNRAYRIPVVTKITNKNKIKISQFCYYFFLILVTTVYSFDDTKETRRIILNPIKRPKRVLLGGVLENLSNHRIGRVIFHLKGLCIDIVLQKYIYIILIRIKKFQSIG